MAAPYTIDASVFVNAFNVGEVGHDQSLEFVSAARARGASVVVPTLLFPEVCAAVARGRDDSAVAQALASDLANLAIVLAIPVDRLLASEASGIAATHRLRGSDAVYAAVALRFGCVLVTRDREQRERLAGILRVQTPTEALAELTF